tara:strand:+ start:371 stop:1612 length:1242 start_codon:yes stop_codon:yes gene_type:complete
MKINSKDDIIEYFKNGYKKKFSIGVENEKFLFDINSKSRANYKQVKNVLDFLKKFGWKEISEDNNLIGLNNNKQSITLEPGNQIELSGGLCENVHQVCAESFKFQKQLDEACAYLGLETLSIGYDPITALQNSPNNPKKRYKVMTKEMPKKGKLSLEMMYQTCGTQINLDYSSEEDFTKKFKIISFLTPLTVALFSNSAVKQGDPTGYLSYRTKVWQNTSRAGLPDFFLDEVTFEKYADFVLNFPLLFYYKNNEYNFPMGKTYKDLVSHEEANSENLELHLSTIFTELRLKKYIELRSLDACEWDCHCAGPAFFTGLLYGNLDETFEVIKDWNKDEIKNAYAESCKKGLRTEINRKDILFWSIKLLQISKKGLEKRSYLNENKKNESVFLKNIENILKNNLTKAEEYLNNFKK